MRKHICATWVEADLGTTLDRVAIGHHDTSHRDVHVVARGMGSAYDATPALRF